MGRPRFSDDGPPGGNPGTDGDYHDRHHPRSHRSEEEGSDDSRSCSLSPSPPPPTAGIRGRQAMLAPLSATSLPPGVPADPAAEPLEGSDASSVGLVVFPATSPRSPADLSTGGPGLDDDPAPSSVSPGLVVDVPPPALLPAEPPAEASPPPPDSCAPTGPPRMTSHLRQRTHLLLRCRWWL
nr:proline-rich receptor-like protein kinase PERK2 [Aegilops tauschii subsp. strangulata]